MTKKMVYQILMIIIGALLASFSVACILLPNDTIDYGTAGIAIIVSKLTGINLSLCVIMIFLPFLIVGGLFLGKRFTLRALIGSFVYTVGLYYFEHIPFEIDTEYFVAVAFGGALLGVGLSMILRFGGCIDGSEIIANIVSSVISEKYNKNISLTGILVAFNACVYAACFILINRTSALMSLLVYVVATSVIDHFTDRFEAIKEVTIITKNPTVMINKIKTDMKKTCTVMNSYGAIAGENKTLICYVTYFELQRLRELISDFEESAFVTVKTVDEIMNSKK